MSYNFDNLIAKRNTKEVYKDNGKTIKLFSENYSKSDVLNEALNQARVEETNLNIPKLIEVTTIDNRWAIVLEYIDGETLESLMTKYPEKKEEYLNLFVDTQIKVLETEGHLLNSLKDKMKRKISEADIDVNIKYELNVRLEGMAKHSKLCHGDFNPSNVIIDKEGKVYVIDWAHVTRGNASADVAMTYLLFCLSGKTEDAEEYLSLYSKKTGTKIEYIKRWVPIVAASHLDKASEEEKEVLKEWVDIIDYQ